MLVESNPGSRINPRTRPDQYVSRVKGLIRLPGFDSTNILVGSSHFDMLMTTSVGRVCGIFSVSRVGGVLEVG